MGHLLPFLFWGVVLHIKIISILIASCFLIMSVGGIVPDQDASYDDLTVLSDDSEPVNDSIDGETDANAHILSDYSIMSKSMDEDQRSITYSVGLSTNNTVVCTYTLTYTLNNGEAAISGLDSESDDLVILMEDSIVLNSTTYNVISIDNSVFTNNAKLSKILLSNNISLLSSKQFSGCTSLNELSLGINLLEIDGYAFERTIISKLCLPSNVKTLSNYAFANMASLKEIEFNTTKISTIPDYCFSSCSALESITIPSGVLSLGKSLFNDCTSLKSIYLPSNITLNAYLFSSSKPSSIVNVYLSSQTTISGTVANTLNLHMYACNTELPTVPTKNNFNKFYIHISLNEYINYTMVEELRSKLPKVQATLTSADGFVYDSTDSSKLIKYVGTGSSATTVTIPSSVMSIGSNAFNNDASRSLTEIHFEGNSALTTIGDSAFSSCTSLTTIDLPGSLTTIGDSAFSSCTSLTTIDLPGSLTTIGDYVFQGCTSLSIVNMNITNIMKFGADPFRYCNSSMTLNITGESDVVEKLTIDGNDFLVSHDGNLLDLVYSFGVPHGNITSLSNVRSLNGLFTNSNITSIKIPSTLASFSDSEFSGCTNLSLITFDESVSINTIPVSCFSNTAISTIDLPSSISTINAKAFNLCHSLKSVTFNGTTLSLIGDPFAYCSSLDSVTFTNLNSALTMGANAFASCNSLKNINLPSGLSAIAIGTFNGCSSLESINLQPGCTKYESVDGLLFEKSSNNTLKLLICPSSKTNIITPSGNVDFNGRLTNNRTIQSIIFSDGFTSIIKDNEFSGCISLTSVTFGDSSSPTSIGKNAFKGTGVYDLVFPNTINSIGSNAFEGCLSLTTVKFNEESKLTSIGDYAFKGCNNLRSFEIPKYLSSIGSNIFMDCALLNTLSVNEYNSSFDFSDGILSKGTEIVYVLPTSESIKIPANITSISSDAFYNNNLKSISVDTNNSNYCSDGIVLFNLDKTKIIVVPGGLEDLTIPSSIQTISIDGGNPFEYVKSLKNITWNGGSLSLSSNVFSNLSTLNSITLVASGDISINGAFVGCRNLESIVISCSNLNLTDSFTNCGYYDLDVNLSCTDSLSLSGYVFNNCNGINKLEVSCKNAASLSLINHLYGTFKNFEYTLNDTQKNTLNSILNYNVSFKFNDLSGDFSANIESIRYDGLIVFSLVSSAGYTYNDLNVSVDNSIVTSNQGLYEYKLLSDVTFTVKERNPETTVTVTFDMMLDELTDTQKTMGVGRTILPSDLPNPLSDNYTFVGWYTNENYTAKYLQAPILKDTTLYAKWNLKYGSKIVFDTSHGNVQAIVENAGNSLTSGDIVADGTSITFSFDPYDGFELMGWDVAVNGVTSTSDNLEFTLVVSGDSIIKPKLRYYSSSSSLINITDLKTSIPGDTFTEIWEHLENVDTSMNVWTGFPSVPLIVDDNVYIRVDDKLYMIDLYGDGKVKSTSAESKTISAYYHYLGYGNGTIFDYATGNAYNLKLDKIYNVHDSGCVGVDISSVSYHDQYFYGLDNTNTLWKFEASTGKLCKDGFWEYGVKTHWHGIYGTISTPVFVQDHIYFIEAIGSEDGRYIGSVDLKTGDRSTTTLNKLNGKLLDDGWLTCYNYKGTNYLFVTGYGDNLFDSSSNSSAIIDCVPLSSDGSFVEESERWIYTDKGVNGTASAFVVYDGRGYVNVTGTTNSSNASAQFYVYDVNSMLDTPLEQWKDATFEQDTNNFLIYQEDSVKSHGSIVVSTAYYNETGKVYIYLIPYEAGEQAIYIFEDSQIKTAPNKYYKSPKIGSAYCSQAVRIGMDGQFIWYNDSGTIYCYGNSEMNDYFFMVDDGGNGSMWRSSSGQNPVEAVKKLGYTVGDDGSVSKDGNNYTIQCCIGDQWFSLPKLDLGGFTKYHYYILSSTNIDSDAYWYYESGGILLKCKCSDILSNENLINTKLSLDPFPIDALHTQDINSIKLEIEIEKSLPGLTGYDSIVIGLHVKFDDSTTAYTYAELEFSNSNTIEYISELGSSSKPVSYSISIYDGWLEFDSNAVCLNQIFRDL